MMPFRLRGPVGLVLVLFFFATGSSCSKKETAPVRPEKAPSFALPGTDGTTVRLSDYDGKVVLIDFWATWCPPCRAAIPHIVELQDTYGPQGFVAIGMNLDQDPDDLADFLSRTSVNYPIVRADEAARMAFGGVMSIPQAFLVDRRGMIREHYQGYSREIAEQMDRTVAALVKEGG